VTIVLDYVTSILEIYNQSSKSYIHSLLRIKFLAGVEIISGKITKPAEFIFSNYLHSTLLGILMGNGNIQSSSWKTLTDKRRFRFGQGSINEPCVSHSLSLFKFTLDNTHFPYKLPASFRV